MSGSQPARVHFLKTEFRAMRRCGFPYTLWWGGDPTKNCNFQRGKVGLLRSKNFNRVTMLQYFIIFRLGAMRLKMKIFKKGNSVLFFMGATWWKITISTKGKWSRFVVFQKYIFRMGTMRLKVTIFKKWNKITKSCGGRCVKKWRFSKGETAFAGVQKISDVLFYVKNLFLQMKLSDLLLFRKRNAC